MAREPRANMLVLFDSCKDVEKYIAEDSASIVGLDERFFESCRDSLVDVGKEVLVIPRRVIAVDRRSLKTAALRREPRVLTAFKPLDTQSARTLAKTRRSTLILVSPDTMKYVDEAQVNFLKQSHARKFIEVSLGEFVKLLLSANTTSMHISRAFDRLGNTIERALRSDIGVAVSGAVESYPKCLFTNHIDAVLFSMGFSKRERRMILEVYPLELLKTWLGEE
uniref:RNase P subunit p30 n=1 Tax=Ignisphaera aggregans TaxID=334771 RepID=A0A7C4BDA6_9CREN